MHKWSRDMKLTYDRSSNEHTQDETQIKQFPAIQPTCSTINTVGSISVLQK